jgi:hypothetical protein
VPPLSAVPSSLIDQTLLTGRTSGVSS